MTYSIVLPTRIRLTAPITIYVAPAGQDISTNGLLYGTNGCDAFETPGYAVAWCCANLDTAGFGVTILIDGPAQYSSTPVPGSRGGIFLGDVLGANTSWTQDCMIISGSINGVQITPGSTPNTNWPVLSFNGISAVCGVANNTVWQIQCLQLQSTIADIQADRCSKINVKNIVHSKMNSPYPTPYKYCSIYGSSIEILDQIWIYGSGTNLWYVAYGSQIIGIGPSPYINSGVSFSGGYTNKDSTSNLIVQLGWPQ